MNIDDFLCGLEKISGESATYVEDFLFAATIMLQSGEIRTAEISHAIQTESNGHKIINRPFFIAMVNWESYDEEIELGEHLNIQRLSYNGINKWIIIE